MLSMLLQDIEKCDWHLVAKTEQETAFMVSGSTSLIFTYLPGKFIRSNLELKKNIKDNKHCIIRVNYYHITGDLVLVREIRQADEYWKKTTTHIETELCRNEEQYFMQSTLNDLSEISLNDMLRLASIIDKLEKKVLYGK